MKPRRRMPRGTAAGDSARPVRGLGARQRGDRRVYYVLPGTHVDVVATVSPTGNSADMTSKVILTNVQVLAAGTKIDRETDKNKPMPVSVVTMLVNPEEAERLTLASTEGKIQLALRNPLDKTIPTTPGVRPSALFGSGAATRTAVATHTAANPSSSRLQNPSS